MRNRLLLILAVVILAVPAILAQTPEPPATQPAPAPAQMGCMGGQAMQKGQTPMSGMMGGDMMKGMMGGDMMKGMMGGDMMKGMMGGDMMKGMMGGAEGGGCPMRAAATKAAATKKK